MSREPNGLAKLGSLLGADPMDVLKALGGPWCEDAEFARDLPWRPVLALPEDDADVENSTQQFLGRVGPPVVLRIDRPPRRLLVGMAVGRWAGPATLVWDAAEPSRTLHIPVNRDPAEVERFLREAGGAVDEAASAKAPTLVTCRYCGAVIAPERALDRDTCYACGSEVHGIVY